MSRWQVVEKRDFGSDWEQVRFSGSQVHLIGKRFDTKEEAMQAAVDYITIANCDNALTPSEKLNNLECFMVTDDGIFLGILDGKKWYLTYPKDIANNNEIVHRKGDIVKDKRFFLLEGKTEVAVRPVPGS